MFIKIMILLTGFAVLAIWDWWLGLQTARQSLKNRFATAPQAPR